MADVATSCPNPCPVCNSPKWDHVVDRAIQKVEGKNAMSVIKTFIRRERAKAIRMGAKPQINPQLTPKAR